MSVPKDKAELLYFKNECQSPRQPLNTPPPTPRDSASEVIDINKPIVLTWKYVVKANPKIKSHKELQAGEIDGDIALNVANAIFKNRLAALNAPFGFTHNDLSLYPEVKNRQ